MVAAVVGAAGVVASAYGAHEQSKQANKAQQSQEKLGQQQLQLGQDTLDFNKGVYNNWQSSFQPILGDIKNQVYANMQPNYAGVNADVNSAFDASQGINQRQMQRMGVRPTDGATSAANTAYGLGRATALVAGDQNERHRVADQRLSNLEGVYQLGNPMLGYGVGGVNSSSGALSNAYGQQQGIQGAYAQQYGAGAGALTNQAVQYGMNAANRFAPGYSNGSGTYTPTWGTTPSYNGPVMYNPPAG